MLLLCLLMYAVEAYMHYEVYITRYSDFERGRAMWHWGMDVMFLLSFFYLFTWGRRKLAFALSYGTILVFALCNIIYSRFFGQYFNFDVLGESSNFKGTWWLSYLPQAFKWSDLLLVALTALFVLVRRRLEDRQKWKTIPVVLSLYAICYVGYMANRVAHWRSMDDVRLWASINYGEGIHHKYMFNQEHTIVHKGIVKTQIYCYLRWMDNKQQLSEADMKCINDYIKATSHNLAPLSKANTVKGKPNVVLIIVESFMSVAAKTTVADKEVMPNINALMKEKDCYVNMEMASNRGSGVSSDAQISYFTGLLPLSNEIAVARIVKNKVVAFPRLLHDQKGYNTYITLPTAKNFWHQSDADVKYGITGEIELGNKENNFFCQDEEIFRKLEHETPKLKEPYLNIILTLSMHGGYDIDFLAEHNYKSPFKYLDSYPVNYRHYLDKCYYTDMQIGRYIGWLKKTGRYDNTVVIICSDHEVPGASGQMGSLCSEELPLILLNSGIDAENFYSGRVNQIDMFPTLLDMFGLKSPWRGIGSSLLREGYDNQITAEKRRISDMILRGDYFSLGK